MFDDSITRAIQASFPDHPSPKVVPLGEGDYCRAADVGGTWVFLFAKHAHASECLDRIARVTPVLSARAPLPLPLVEHHGTVDGQSFVGYRKIAGHPLGQRLSMLEASSREAMVADLAEVLRYLHSFDIDQARGLGVPETDYAFPMRDDYLLTGDAPALYQDDLTAFSASSVADVEVLNVLRTLLDRYLARTENRRGRVALLHNEVSGDHVLVDASGRVTGIIDLNGMVLGPAVRDFLYLYELLGTSFVREVIKAYGLLDPEEALEDLQFLHVWHTLLRLLWAIEHRFERGIVERSRALRTLCAPAS